MIRFASVFKIIKHSLCHNYGNPLKHNICTTPIQRRGKNMKEVQIPVPWGHIAGAWWGPENVRPILCLHGYEDNAGTWDTLIPLLPPDISYLAIDFPGHGYSSHLPSGIQYNLDDFVLTICRVMNWYGWDKISLLGHSLGSTIAFAYAALYPEHVDRYIAIDSMKPFSVDSKKKLTSLMDSINIFLKIESSTKRPSYTYEQAVDHLHKNIKHWASKEVCVILSKRGTVKLPNGSYIFSRDPRLKAFKDLGYTHETDMSLASNIKCKILFITAKQGLLYESLELRKKFLNIVKNSAEIFESYNVEGSHHVHLDYPERIAPFISDFLKKY